MRAFLHLSDLHVSESILGRSEQRCALLREKLCKDIQENFSHLKIDSVFITGDIAYSGKPKEYRIFTEKILDPLLAFLHLSYANVYIAPGNHDVDRSAVSSADSMAEKLYQKIGWTEEIGKYFEEIMNEGNSLDRQGAYYDFAKSIFSKNPNLLEHNPFFQAYRVKTGGKSLVILSLNSAILARGGKDDNGRLLIGKSQVQAAFDVIKREYTEILVLAHHPLEWLSEDDRERFSEFLHQKVDLYLCGHMHKYLPASSEIHGDIVVKLQTGAFDAQKIDAGYSICVLDAENTLSSGRVHYRQWRESKDAFSAWEERGKSGEDSFSHDVIKFDIGKLSHEAYQIEEEIDAELVINANRTKSERLRLIDIFDKPILVKGLKLTASELLEIEQANAPANKHKELREEKRSESAKLKRISEWEQLDFDNLMTQGNSYIISGGEDQGKTTILNYLMVLGLHNLQAKAIDRLHIKIDYRDVGKGKIKSIDELVIQIFERSPELRGIFSKKIVGLLESGHCLILVDNYDPTEEKKSHALRSFIQKYKANDLIVTVKEAIINDVIAEEGPFRAGKSFQMLRISSIKRKNIRAFISKIYNDTPAKQDVAYKAITDAIKTARLPGNHFVYAMLLEIYSSKFSLDHIYSEADIVENFIEILLRKQAMSEHHQDDPRYKDILMFFGYVATTWMEIDQVKADRNDFLMLALQFNQKSKFQYPAQRYVDIGVECGILVDRHDGIYFAQKCFHDYAAANFIKPGSAAEARLLGYAGMVRWDKIVEYYCAKSKNPQPIIDAVRRHLALARERCESYVVTKYGDGDYKKRIEELMKGDGLADLIKQGVGVFPNHESITCNKEENDEEQDGDESGEDSRADALEIQQDYSAFSDYETLLSLFGRVIKSSPHMMDADFQEAAYHHAIKEYRDFIGIAMVVLERELWPEMKRTISKYFSRLGVAEIETKAFLDRAEGFLGVVLSFVPRLIQRGMATDLGALSHETTINDIIKSGKATDEECALLRFLKCDLEMGGYIDEVELIQGVDVHYIQISLYLKICEMLKYDYKLDEPARAKLKRTARKLAELPSIRRSVNLLAFAQERAMKDAELPPKAK
jgi:predicted MPP superfamily phosphohydrolase